MNITNTRLSLLRLWLESFRIVNRCTGKFLWLIIISIVLFALAIGVFVLAVGTSGALAAMQMGRASQAVGIGAALGYLLLSLGGNLYGIIFWTVCWRLVANEAQEEQQSLAETFSSSVLPAIYQIAGGFLLAIPMILLGIVAALLRSPVLVGVLMLALFFTVGVRLAYSFMAMAVAGKGPIEGFTHSWKMTQGSNNFLDTLLMLLMTLGTVLLLYAFFALIGYGLFVLIPLHFANSFSLAHPSLIWILVAVVLGALAIFGYFVVLAFPVLVFINRNAALFDARNMSKDTTFVPLPNLELPDILPNPDHMQQAESTVRTPAVSTEQAAPAQAAPKPQAPAPQAQAQEKEPLDGLEVSKSSINTSEEDTNTLSQHLDKVYKPKPEDIVQYVDEDRMPTILFDEEMAKQLQENQAQYATKPKDGETDKKDNGPDTIKMSKF